MNAFTNMLKETVYVVSNGERRGPFKTAIDSGKLTCTIFDEEFDADEGDKLFQQLPNGKYLEYEITEIAFNTGIASIPNHYRLHLSKKGTRREMGGSTNISVSGSSNVQIGDGNTINIETCLNSLVRTIEDSATDEKTKANARGALRSFLGHPAVIAVFGAVAAKVLQGL